jgi:hypothetical protein
VVGSIPVALGHEVVTVDSGPEGLRVGFGNGEDVTVDHALLGTGYRVDLSRYSFLSEELLSTVRQVDGYPRLGRGFESSVPGLHFLGAPAAWTYGPLMRFIAGTGFSAMELRRGLSMPVSQGRRQPVATAA